MAHIMPQAGKKQQLHRIKDAGIPDQWRIGLFTARLALAPGMTLADDITEATFGGYARKQFVFGPVNDFAPNHFAITDHQIMWTWAGGAQETITGWFVVDLDADRLLWVEDFGAPRSMRVGGDQIPMSVAAVLGQLIL